MPPTSMTDLLFKAQKYMNGEDALTAKGLAAKQKKEESNDLQNRKKDRKDHSSDTKISKNGSFEEKVKFHSFGDACR